ncbi:MAG: hypothetical protein AAFQ94_26025 [Bacteroidota bacterium]
MERKKGSVGEINAILVMMMRKAGLNAEPIILSTRRNGLLHPIYPDADEFNYLLAGVKLNENWVMLDASTGRGYPFGMIPVKCLNGSGWIVSYTQAGWVPLKGYGSAATVTQSTLNLREDGTIDGNMKISTKGYADISRRKALYLKGKEDYIESMKEDLPDWKFDSVYFENEEDIYSSLIANYKIHNKENIHSEIIYLKPIIISQYEKNPFEPDEREMPVDFAYQTEERYVMELKIPEGYAVDELPKPAVFQLPDRAAKYQFSASRIGNKISIINILNISGLFYPVEEYESIKKFFELMIEKQAEQIVIKKI